MRWGRRPPKIGVRSLSRPYGLHCQAVTHGNAWVYGGTDSYEYLSVLDELTHFQVFDSSGRWLGGMELPVGGQVAEIGADYLLGIWTYELEIQSIRMYGLDKPTVGSERRLRPQAIRVDSSYIAP